MSRSEQSCATEKDNLLVKGKNVYISEWKGKRRGDEVVQTETSGVGSIVEQLFSLSTLIYMIEDDTI